MNMLVKKAIIFLVPVFLYCLMIALVDPFNYFRLSEVIADDLKKQVSAPNNEFLWKCSEFRQNPCRNILLGDSRTEALDARKIEKITGERYYNFACGGATPPEIVDTFWYAVRFIKPAKVYIGMNFDAYNRSNSMNRFPEIDAIMRNPFLYFANDSVITSVRYLAKSSLAGSSVTISHKPKATADEFWKDQLEFSRNAINDRYGYPATLYADLRRIKAYCDKNQIQLCFIVLPTHIDMQERISRFNLQRYHSRFYQDVKSLGKMYDFDYKNKITSDREWFIDPYHLKNTDIVINDVWGQAAPSVSIVN